MRIEVLCTGDELVTGAVADTNSRFFLDRLFFSLGQVARRVQVIGDVREEIVGALRRLSEQADVVLVSGGLGPTSDDLTVACAAEAAGVPLVEDAGVMKSLRERFARRGLELTPNNAKQALAPVGAEVVPNPVGTAPMLVQRIGRCTFFYVPGVPREFYPLVEQEVLPRIATLLESEPGRTFRAFTVLKTVGLPESHLDHKVDPFRAKHPKVIFGFRTHGPENHLKLLAEGDTPENAAAALRDAEAECRPVLEPWLFGANDQTLAGSVGELLQKRGETLALAESCTGGLVAQLITAVPGASDWFVGAAVAYRDSMKQRWAHVSPEALSRHSAVSREVAAELAQGVRATSSATWGLATTGYAGPTGGTAEDPIGTVYCALAQEGDVRVERHTFPPDRDRVRTSAAYLALDMVRRRILGVA